MNEKLHSVVPIISSGQSFFTNGCHLRNLLQFGKNNLLFDVCLGFHRDISSLFPPHPSAAEGPF
jgi:hypothetical protein